MRRTIRRGCDTARFHAVPVSSDGSVSRRNALKLGSGGALALAIGLGAGWVDRRGAGQPAELARYPLTPGSSSTTTTTTTTTTPAPPVDVADIGEVDPAIILLGRRVIETTGEDDLAALVASLPDADGDPLERAATRTRDDFRTGATIVVDGWVLAASEARAAAAIALLCGDAC